MNCEEEMFIVIIEVGCFVILNGKFFGNFLLVYNYLFFDVF